MADATDSKSVVGNNMWVQVPPPVPFLTLGVNFASGVLCILFEKVTGFCLNLLKNKKHTRFLQEFSQNH